MVDYKIICECGVVIDMEWRNRCNEEGDEYSEVTAYCKTCKKDYECGEWREIENYSEAVTTMIDYGYKIKPV